MTIINEEIIKECKSWKGTKFGHGVALKGYMADCIQFGVAVYRNLGMLPSNFKTQKYNRDWALHNSESVLVATIQKYCHQIQFDDIRVGDILLFKFGKCASHTAIYIGDGKIIHSVVKQGVIESNLKDWMGKFVSAWRLSE